MNNINKLSLPDDILTKVFYYANLKDLCMIKKLCNSYKYLVNTDDIIWLTQYNNYFMNKEIIDLYKYDAMVIDINKSFALNYRMLKYFINNYLGQDYIQYSHLITNELAYFLYQLSEHTKHNNNFKSLCEILNAHNLFLIYLEIIDNEYFDHFKQIKPELTCQLRTSDLLDNIFGNSVCTGFYDDNYPVLIEYINTFYPKAYLREDKIHKEIFKGLAKIEYSKLCDAVGCAYYDFNNDPMRSADNSEIKKMAEYTIKQLLEKKHKCTWNELREYLFEIRRLINNS